MVFKIVFDKCDPWSGSEVFVGTKEQVEFRASKLKKMGCDNVCVTSVGPRGKKVRNS